MRFEGSHVVNLQEQVWVAALPCAMTPKPMQVQSCYCASIASLRGIPNGAFLRGYLWSACCLFASMRQLLQKARDVCILSPQQIDAHILIWMRTTGIELLQNLRPLAVCLKRCCEPNKCDVNVSR